MTTGTHRYGEGGRDLDGAKDTDHGATSPSPGASEKSVLDTGWNWLRVALVLASVGVAPFVTHVVVDRSPVEGGGDVIRTVGTYGWRVLFVMVFTTFLLIPKRGGPLSWRRGCLAVLVGASYIAGWVDGVSDDEFTPGLSDFALGASVLAVGATLVFVAPTYALEAWWTSRRRREERDRDPQGYAMARIAEVLAHLQDGIPRNPEDLRATLDSFEEAALAIELGVSGRAHLREGATAEWLSQHTRRRAEAIRDLKRAVCLPQEETFEFVVNRLTEAYECITHGLWGDLPEALPPPTSTDSFRVRAGRAARELVGGILPLGAVGALEVTVGLEGGLAAGAWTFAAGWALVTVLSLLDPRLAEKLSLTKALREASS